MQGRRMWMAAIIVVGGVSRFILTKADPSVNARITGLTEAGLSYLEYDWSLNDSARSK